MSSNPPPVKNGETPTTDTLLARPWVRSSWSYLFRRRQELGVARYGTPLQPFNGRDAILDAAEEFQDATVYAEQCIREGRVPLLVGAALQLLCLFALRVLWYYAGVVTRERILGRDRPVGVGDATLLSPREPVEERLPDIGPGPCPILVGTYDPPDSQEPPGFLEDTPTMNLRAVVPSKVPGAGAISAAEAEESNALETEPEPEQEVGTGWGWIANGPIYNGVHSWQWQGGANNKGNSVAKFLDDRWKNRAWSENASEA